MEDSGPCSSRNQAQKGPTYQNLVEQEGLHSHTRKPQEYMAGIFIEKHELELLIQQNKRKMLT